MNPREIVWTTLAIALTLTLSTAPALAAQSTASVTGRVVDSTSAQPVAGARVGVVGTSIGSLTDRDGRYLLRGVPAGTVTLRAQRIGFAPHDQTVTVTEGATATVDFVLTAAATVLSDVVVTGYGTDSRANLSSSVSSVSAAQIQGTPSAGLEAAMQGQAAGVQVVQNAGNPGVGMTVRIRGAASITASNQPLYVIDGVPLIRDDFSQLDVGGQDITGVTGLNPDEIEKIDILKDAAAAAIYGSRGSNGVVMITTKRGRVGAGRFTFNTYGGSQSVPASNRWDMMNASEYITFMNEAAENDGYGADYFSGICACDPAIVGAGTDWQGQVFRSAVIRNATLGITGGSERVQYYISGSQFKQDGVVLGSGYHRESGRVNLDITATDRLRFRSSMSVSREQHDRIENDNSIAGVVTNAIANQPWVNARRVDGTFTTTDDGLEYENPLAIANYDLTQSRGLRVLGSLEAAYSMTNRLSLTGRFGMDVLNLRDLRWYSPNVGGSYGESVGGESIIGNNTPTRYVVEGFADFHPQLNSSTTVSFVGGASAEWNSAELDYVDGIGFAGDHFQYPGNAATVVNYDGDWTGHNLVSFFSRANMTFRDRYLVTASLRADASSRFGNNNRWGTFPAISVGWKITDEPFARALARRSDIKLRLSYGVTGNQDLNDNFAPLSRFGRANYGDNAGFAQNSFGNANLKWERTTEYNAGLDITLLGGRVTLIGDWYRKNTDNLLLSRPITSTSGLTTATENIGSIRNRGFELTINTVPLEPSTPEGLRWSTEFNISWNRNEVTKLFQDEPFSVGLYSTSRVEVGHPLSAFYTLRFLGVDPATGDAIFDDINNDGSIDAADRTFIGSPHPRYWGGFTNTLSWKNFDLRSFLQFTQGHTIFNAIGVFANDGGYYHDNKFRRLLDRWQVPGDVTDVPRASYDGTSGADLISSRYFEDGSYVRLQEMTLSYRLPVQWAAALRMADSRLYVSGRNLHTWTKYSGYSPDVNSNGSSSNTALATEFYAYPLARTIMVGISGAF
jgi:TonB-linked SusC/RagA family outer membrane protein